MQTHISVAHCSSKLWLVDMVRNEQFFSSNELVFDSSKNKETKQNKKKTPAM